MPAPVSGKVGRLGGNFNLVKVDNPLAAGQRRAGVGRKRCLGYKMQDAGCRMQDAGYWMFCQILENIKCLVVGDLEISLKIKKEGLAAGLLIKGFRIT